MKIKSIEDLFDKTKVSIYESLVGQYNEAIELSSDKYERHKLFDREFSENSYKTLSSNNSFCNMAFDKIEDLLLRNNKLSFSDALSVVLNGKKSKQLNSEIKILAEHKAHREFIDFLGKESQKNSLRNSEDKLEYSNYDETKNTEFTTSRQVLAIHYLLKTLEVKNADKTEIARFIQFLTGKEAGNKKIKNTTIYKKVCNPFRSNDITLKEDLKYVKSFFDKLGLYNVSLLIENELNN